MLQFSGRFRPLGIDVGPFQEQHPDLVGAERLEIRVRFGFGRRIFRQFVQQAIAFGGCYTASGQGTATNGFRQPGTCLLQGRDPLAPARLGALIAIQLHDGCQTLGRLGRRHKILLGKPMPDQFQVGADRGIHGGRRGNRHISRRRGGLAPSIEQQNAGNPGQHHSPARRHLLISR